MMTRFHRIIALAIAALPFTVLTLFAPASRAFAQAMVLGGLVEGRSYYNGYGIEDYGGYGVPGDKYNGFGHPYGVYDFSYSGYGNGPYGAGGASEHEFLSTNRYSHGDAIYDGYGAVGYSSRLQRPETRPARYNPYGFGVPKSRRHYDW
jgi:hypothetical protein